jgi:hypothetical protein
LFNKLQSTRVVPSKRASIELFNADSMRALLR